MKKACKVYINNMPQKTEKYVVARFDEDGKELWYWGSWDDVVRAKEVAEEVGGIVTEVE